MAKKHHYLIIDTETTVRDHVVDFGAVIVDRKGSILHQCGVLVKEYFGHEALFYLVNEDASNLWSEQGRDRRYANYLEMLDNGSRMLASVTAINRWLERAKGQYNPALTAYNLAFDLDKCNKTGIDLTMFSNSFCLWHTAASKWGHTKEYKQFVLDNHEFNPPTKLRNMSYKTNAEIMARFVLGQPELENEPHTALEDATYYELPILRKLLRNTSQKDLLTMGEGYNWRNYQVNQHFKPI